MELHDPTTHLKVVAVIFGQAQSRYLDFLYEFYGMATGVRTALIGLVGNMKGPYQKNIRFFELA
jgi:hypothetical protein